MLNNIKFINKELSNNQAIIVLVNEQLQLDSDLLLIDQQYHGLISKTIQNSLIFTGKFGEIKIVNAVNKDGEIKYLIIVGIGQEAKLTTSCLEEIGGKILSSSNNYKISTIGFKITRNIGQYETSIVASLIASGFFLAAYRFDKFKTKQTAAEKFTIDYLEISTDNIAKAEELFNSKKLVAKAVFFARDISNEPANIKNPLSYSERISEILEPFGIDVTIIGEREMKNLGMGALLGVGQGSQNESKLVVMNYNGLGDDTRPVAFVGKGVTFDSGGISIKPATNMGDMKYDMAGSAAVVGALMALASRKAKANIVGVVGLVENMPSGNAQRPGDIITTMSGQTVEVGNTDAEGRLVLADAIWYTQEKFNPQCVIDLATLTGAIVVALGKTYAGCFANNEQLANRLIAVGNKVNEKLWRLPLHQDFDKMINSDIADISNIGNVPGAAGSCTAAQFIGRFIKDEMIWAHLDIAGVSYNNKECVFATKGATAYGVRLLNQFIQDYYEQ
jgi:leucyl aminopeptidase